MTPHFMCGIFIIGSYQKILFPWNRSLRRQSAKYGIANASASEIYDKPCLLKIRAILKKVRQMKDILERFRAALSGFQNKT